MSPDSTSGSGRNDYWKVVLECVDEELSTYEYEYTCPVTPRSESPRGAIDCALNVAARAGHSASGVKTVRVIADADEILDDRDVDTGDAA